MPYAARGNPSALVVQVYKEQHPYEWMLNGKDETKKNKKEDEEEEEGANRDSYTRIEIRCRRPIIKPCFNLRLNHKHFACLPSTAVT